MRNPFMLSGGCLSAYLRLFVRVSSYWFSIAVLTGKRIFFIAAATLIFKKLQHFVACLLTGLLYTSIHLYRISAH